MIRRRGWLIASTITAVGGGLAGGWATLSSAPAAKHERLAPALSESKVRDLDIDFWARKAAADTLSAASRAKLAGLYLQRARDVGDYDDYKRAERVARESVALRVTHNSEGYQLLASSLMAQHRFGEALVAARRAAALDPDVASRRAQLGEIQVELGMYDSARVSFDAMRSRAGELAVAPRFARWLELQGHTNEARGMLRRVLDRTRDRGDLPREQRAWFYLRVADFELRHGRLAAADSFLSTGLALAPDDARLLGLEARVCWSRGDWRGAADAGERAVAIQLDPATLGTVSDAYASLGDTARATEFAVAMRTAVLAQTGPLHRAWSLFLLDHDRDVDSVAVRVRRELKERRDIYGYDLQAWARHKQGHDADAHRASERALSLGVEDALLFYHAGVIDAAIGDTAAARVALGRALAINPFFNPHQAAHARALIDSLGR